MFVNSVEYIDKDGERTPYDTANQIWKFESVAVDYECPICSHNQEKLLDAPLKSSTRITCSECERQYFAKAVVNPNRGESIKHMDLKSAIETQLESVSKVGNVCENNIRVTTRAAHYPDATLLAVGAIFIGYVVFGIATLNYWELVQSSLFFKAVFIMMFISPTLGVFSVSIGPLKYSYLNYMIYKESEFSFSYYEFLLHLGNYYHSDPFALFH